MMYHVRQPLNDTTIGSLTHQDLRLEALTVYTTPETDV